MVQIPIGEPGIASRSVREARDRAGFTAAEIKNQANALPEKLFRIDQHYGGKTVNHHQLDVEIQHLEYVIRLISANDRIPLSYWRNRLNAVSAVAVIPSQVSRVKRLNDALRELENQCEVTPVAVIAEKEE
jgi:hypothetical protein